ncbi:MAG: MFS transporter, partial [Anaerolineae bacterium]|nr:MFS transporter [Anaerolineae bacterium]
TPPFFWWILNRVLFWSAAISLKTFALNYIEDTPTLSLADLPAVSHTLIFGGGAGVLLVVLGAGLLADRIGRRPLLVTAGLLAVGGTLLLVVGRDLTWLFAAGGVLVTSGGVYASASWALATDLAPPHKGALYLGLANGATVIGSISGRLGGPLIDSVNHLTGQLSLGYLVVFALAGLCFLGSSLVILKIPSSTQRDLAQP